MWPTLALLLLLFLVFPAHGDPLPVSERVGRIVSTLSVCTAATAHSNALNCSDPAGWYLTMEECRAHMRTVFPNLPTTEQPNERPSSWCGNTWVPPDDKIAAGQNEGMIREPGKTYVLAMCYSFARPIPNRSSGESAAILCNPAGIPRGPFHTLHNCQMFYYGHIAMGGGTVAPYGFQKYGSIYFKCLSRHVNYRELPE